MLDLHAALLRAILEQPEDDLPRLALADYLDEQGGKADREYAQFIREQIATGTVCDDWNIGAALVITGAVASAGPWLRIGRATVRRGFVAAVTLSTAAFVEHAAALFVAAPLE